MEFAIDKEAYERLERVRQLGRTHIRPLGIEADKLGRPVPPDHEYFKLLLKGRSRSARASRRRPRAARRSGCARS